MQNYNALQQLEIEANPIETGSYFFFYTVDDSLEQFNKGSGFPKIGIFK